MRPDAINRKDPEAMTRLESCEVTQVEQCDRDAAAGLAEWLTQAQRNWGGREIWFMPDFPNACRQGIWDGHDWVQSFAYHRQNTRATPTPSVDAAKEMLATAHDLRNNANGDCGAIQQAIYWEQKARALLDADAVEVVARALYECERKRSEYTDAVISAAAGKKVSVGMEPWEECWQVFHGDARAAIAAIEPLLRRKHQEESADEILLLRARIEELRRALEPFADHADFYDDCEQHPGGCPDNTDCGEVVDLTVGDFRRARAAIGKAKP